jgi:hypothetical protein
MSIQKRMVSRKEFLKLGGAGLPYLQGYRSLPRAEKKAAVLPPVSRRPT